MSDDLIPVEPAEDAPAEEKAGELVSPQRGKLTLKRGGAPTDISFEFHSPATVGRFDPAVGPIDVDLGSIDESVYVSRKHARLSCEEGQWRVTDQGSSNGTFVLGDDFERVEDADISDGSEVAFGNARFVFSIVD